MPTPGFPVGTLTESGDPAWVDELSADPAHHQLHVVRGLSPQDAVTALGGTVLRNLEPGQLPEAVPDGYTPLCRVAVGEEDDERGVLVAGQSGEWTFVYDDQMLGEFPAAAALLLSRDGRVAASSSYSINADTDLAYAVDGVLTHCWSEPHHGQDIEFPTLLRPAVKAAGVYGDNPGVDMGVNLRVVCALAGLTWTVSELRRSALLVALCAD